jgi:hypothetical protein
MLYGSQFCDSAKKNQFFSRKKRVDNRPVSATFPRIMKSESLNGLLTFALGVLVVLGVILAVRMALLTHEYRSLQKQATYAQAIIMQTQSVYNDAAVYNQTYKDPRLAKILSTVVQPKAANR